MAKEDFDLYWRTHLVTSSQGCNLPEVTVLYWQTTKEETSNFPWTRREGTPRSHATAAAAHDLLTQVRVSTRKNVLTATLIQNYSPCSQCSEEILKTITLANDKRIRIDISIAFVALNRIRRPSWIWRGMADAIHGVTINESNDNSFALYQLQQAGVRLSTFNPDTWQFLYTFLGNGFPVKNQERFLGGKYSNAKSRMEEDRYMEVDIRQILRGLLLTSPSIGLSSSTLDIEWSRPSLTADMTSEYKIVCKKVIVKNREDDDRSWRIQQIVDKTGVKVTVSGEVTSFTVTNLDLDTFYDVTVEAVVKGMPMCVGRKLFRTGNKVPIPSLQPRTVVRKLSTSARPRTSSVTNNNNNSVAVLATSARLKRSNSIQGATRESHHASELDSETKISAHTAELKRSNSGATEKCVSDVDGIDNDKSSTLVQGLSRFNSVRSTTDRSISSSVDRRRKMSETGETAHKVTPGVSSKGSGESGGQISNRSSIGNTAF